jgi:Putative DNA-binding domain
MCALRETQARFRDALLGADSTRPLRTIAADGLSAEGRLALYRHHVATTLTDALRATFPVVSRLVGDGFFAYAMHHYIAVSPPTSPCLFEYGETLPAFLASFEPCRALAYLPDVARLEWAMSRATHGDDAPPLDPRTLSSIPASERPDLRFTFHPSVTLLDSAWPIDTIWRANQPEADPGLTVDLGVGGVHLEVRRTDEEVVLDTLDAGDYILRRELHAGRTLGEAAATALARHADLDLTTALARLLHHDTLTGFTLTMHTEVH